MGSRGFGTSAGRFIRPFPSSTRACGAGVASSFAVDFSVRTGRSRGCLRAEMPGFFALAAVAPASSCGMAPPRRIQRQHTPCAHRLGEQTKSPYHGRVLSLRERAGQFLAAALRSRNQGLDFLRTGLMVAGTGPHTPFTKSIPLATAPIVHWTPWHEGPAPSFRPLPVRSTLPRGEKPSIPSGPVAFNRRSTPSLVLPRGFAWTSPSRCFDFASTTDVSRHEHPRKHHLWRPPPRFGGSSG